MKFENGKYYWVKYQGTWGIGRYVEQFKQFQMTGRTVYGFPNIEDVMNEPIKRIPK
jgi:hypothetical protein